MTEPKKYYEATPNNDGTWRLHERHGGKDKLLLAPRLSFEDAEALVKLGNRFWSTLEAVKLPVNA